MDLTVPSFNDERKWGQTSFLDYLEANDVPFHFDGKELSFPDEAAYQRAQTIWECLTGMRQIGVVA